MTLPLHSRRTIPAVLATVAVHLACSTEPTETELCEGFPDWQTSPYVLPYPVGARIQHEDGTVDLYGHLTHEGVDVTVGQVVATGAVLGRSGNTGNTANKPHLHFSKHSCDPAMRGSNACPTLPVTFRNTSANPTGLLQGGTYEAQAVSPL